MRWVQVGTERVATIREVVDVAQAWPGMTDDKRRALGITVRASPSPVPRPTQQPSLRVTSVVGRVLRLRVSSLPTGKRRKPAGVTNVWLFLYVGEQPAADISAWSYQGADSKTDPEVVVPAAVAAWTNGETMQMAA